MKEIPLLAHHVSKGAEVGEFAGWRSPISFARLREEHQAVRSAAGIFDISHMTRVKITGPMATALLQKTLTCDVAGLKKHRMKYGLFLNTEAGIIDDVTVFKVEENSYVIVSNAATRERVLSWLRLHSGPDVATEDFTETSAFFAVQGPRSPEYVRDVLGVDVDGLRWFSGLFLEWRGCNLLLTRSGYTGEDGFEIVVPCTNPNLYSSLWDSFVSAGVQPCGLACRDTCRLEAGYLLSGVDFDESRTPVETGLLWAVKMEKEGFVGSEVLKQLSGKRPEKTAVFLKLVDQGIPRHGYRVYGLDGSEVGYITSGAFSPLINRGLAVAYVDTDHAVPGGEVNVEMRGVLKRATVLKEPLVRFSKR